MLKYSRHELKKGSNQEINAIESVHFKKGDRFKKFKGLLKKIIKKLYLGKSKRGNKWK